MTAAALASIAPVERRLVSEAVFDHLLGRVLDGSLAPGDPLPSERALGGAFAVNRHAVREALKRLQQAGLVQVAQGGATRVLDWRRSAGLDLLTGLVASARGPQRRALMRDVAELRAGVGVDAARRCAERTPAAARAAAPVDPGAPFPERAEAYVAFWETLVDGAANVAYRLAFNTLVAAQREGAIDPHLYAGEIDDEPAQRALAAAVAAGDGAQSERLAAALLERTLEALTP